MSFGYQILGFGSGVSGVSASADQGRTGDYSTYKVFVFTGSGTFTVTGGDLTGVDIAVIAGGGGGQQTYAGGGGAGGVTEYTNQTLSAGAYTVTIGGGGNRVNGNDSQFGSLTASDGGGLSGNYEGGDGNAGGSGGGGANGIPGEGGAVSTAGQGNVGGDGGDGVGGGGGGGYGAKGQDGAFDGGTVAGDGGIGGSTLWSMNATNTSALLWAAQLGTNSSNAALSSLGSDPGTSYFAGGAGAGMDSSKGDGGAGGGGDGNHGGTSDATNGLSEMGGGGGGRAYSGPRGNGGAGGCIIRYSA